MNGVAGSARDGGAETVIEVGQSLAELGRCLEELQGFLERHGVAARGRFQTELVFEELVTNVVRYGYDGGGETVEVMVRIEPDDIVMVVSDEGRPFNPLERQDPEAPESLADASIGGLGIMLVRKAARHMAYERDGNRNRLTVVIPNE